MGKIFYGVSGEGRGHATRARTLIDELAEQGHEVVLYTSGLGYDLLAPTYLPEGQRPDHCAVDLRRIPGLQFHYSPSKHLDYARTAWKAMGFIGQLPALVKDLSRQIEQEQPDLIITDFEPVLPRAARRLGVPFISFDHQHFLVTYDLSSLPWDLRQHARFMGLFCGIFCRGQEHSLVSSFYFPSLRPEILANPEPKVTQLGVLLRPEILHAQPTTGPHLLAYLRRFSSPRILEHLQSCGVPVKVYGLGEQPSQGNLTFHATDLHRFAEDLIHCRGLVSTAGNQLVGEALYLGKLVLAMPEPGNREQQINAHFLQRSGGGIAVEMDQLELSHLQQLLDGTHIAESPDRQRLCGNAQAVEWVNDYLEKPTHAKPPLVPADRVAQSSRAA